MNSLSRWITATAAIALTTGFAWADWPQYRGPQGNGTSDEKMLESWPSQGPEVLWKIPVGGGLGSFAIKDGKAYYLAAQGNNESVHAINMTDGKQIWSTAVGPTQQRGSGQGGSGPGSTPVTDGERVYAYGSRLRLVCLNTADGKLVWEHDIQEEFNGQGQSSSAISRWGNTTSPILVDDLLIIQGGGSGQTFLAFNKVSGDVVWKKETQILTQSTPAVATIADVKQVIFLVQSGLVSIDPKNGETLWKQPYQEATAIGASPVVEGDIVYCSVGYGVGGGAYQVTKEGSTFSVRQLWRTRGKSMNMWSTPVIKDGYVYGIDGHGGQKRSPLKCIDLKTGREMWTGPGVGGGEVVLINDKLIVQDSDGKLMLVEPTPTEYKELASAQPIRGQAWGWPAFSDGVFLYRTNQQAAAIDLSAD